MTSDDSVEPIRAERQTVIFFEGLEVDGYRMPDGEFRVSLSGASLALGYARNWLSRSMNQPRSTTVKALQGLGFSEKKEKVVAQSSQGNSIEAETISLDDFNCCIIYATQQKKKPAIAINRAFTKLSLLDFFRDAFGETALSIEEKRRIFYETYAASIIPEEWRQMEREDIIKLALPGDEPHLRDGLWNQ